MRIYDLDPLGLFLCQQVFGTRRLSHVEIYPDYSDKQIDAENAADEDKCDKYCCNLQIVLIEGARRTPVDCKIHVIWPCFQGTQDKKTHKTVQNIIVIHVVIDPFWRGSWKIYPF